jgi:hypothetical protein
MEQYVQLIEHTLEDEPEIKNYTTRVSGNTISINVDLLDKAERKKQ